MRSRMTVWFVTASTRDGTLSTTAPVRSAERATEVRLAASGPLPQTSPTASAHPLRDSNAS
jgi:hypothetical protein